MNEIMKLRNSEIKKLMLNVTRYTLQNIMMLKRIVFLFLLFFLLSSFLMFFTASIINRDNKDNIPKNPSSSQSVFAQETECSDSDTINWCQVQRTPQRTGYTPEVLCTNYPNSQCPSFPVIWTYPFQPDRVYPQVQAIIYDGKVFVGTEGANTEITGNNGGTMYALDAVNPDPQSPIWAKKGKVIWKYSVGAPILSSVAAYDGKVFFGAMDGAVYALNASDGSLVWKKQLSQSVKRLGISASPVIAEGKVMLGGRDGIFYALDPSTGNVIWEYNVGSPILQTAAYNNSKVFFGAMDMYVYAINTNDGSLAWKSEKVPGIALKDYWPVVYNGVVIIRPLTQGRKQPGIVAGFPFSWFSDSQYSWLDQNGLTIASGNLTSISEAMNAQNTALANYANNPNNYTKTMYALNESSGQETFVVPHWTHPTMSGATPPPCVDIEGKLIVPTMFVRSGWGRLDLDTKRIVDILFDNKTYNGGPISSIDYNTSTPAGTGNTDETLNVTCAANQIVTMHNFETYAGSHYNGAFDLNNRRWFFIPSGHRNQQMSTTTGGGGGNSASVANGLIYHISWHELIARTTR